MVSRFLLPVLVICLLFDLGAAEASAQEPATDGAVSVDSVHVERLADLTELYGVVSFFHPRLPRRAPAWDSAYAASAERIATTSDSAAHFGAVSDLLSVLDDPATRLRSPVIQLSPFSPLYSQIIL